MRATMAREAADVVYAVRRKREGETLFKKATAAGFYRVLDQVTDTPIPLDTGDFRLMSRRALDAFLSLPEQARLHPRDGRMGGIPAGALIPTTARNGMRARPTIRSAR